MKAPVFFGSLLALVGATVESANAAIADVEIPEELKEAVCFQDWYKAIELSTQLIASPTITPDHRQTLLDIRHHFYGAVKGDPKADELLSCTTAQSESTQLNTPLGPTPRFSTYTAPATPSTSSKLWPVGMRIEGNSIKGTMLNNGWTTFKNVTLTIRSQQNDQTDTIKTIGIEAIDPWSETDFVATFSNVPGSWAVESIEVN